MKCAKFRGDNCQVVNTDSKSAVCELYAKEGSSDGLQVISIIDVSGCILMGAIVVTQLVLARRRARATDPSFPRTSFWAEVISQYP